MSRWSAMRRPSRQAPRALVLPLLVLVLVLLLLLVLPAASAGRLFQLTISGQRFTGTPLETTPVGAVQCAALCASRADCRAFQTSSAPLCLLLSAAPAANQLTASAGDSVFVMVVQCPSGWTLVDTACYFIATPGNTESLWQEDSNFCATSLSVPAILPAFETEAQYSFITSNITGRVWMNIRYEGGAWQMFGGPTGTLWQQKWATNEPTSTDDGYVYYHDYHQKLSAVPLDAGPMPRTQVVCMIYIG